MRDEYWQITAEIAPVLDTLKCATTVMSTEENVSVSNIQPPEHTPDERRGGRPQSDRVQGEGSAVLKGPHGTPGTSVPSERVFSAAGLTVNRLSPQHVDMLLF